MPNIEEEYEEAIHAFKNAKAKLVDIRERRAVQDGESLRLHEIIQKKVCKALYDRMKELESLCNTCDALENMLPVLRDPEYQAMSALVGKPRYRVH